MRLNALRSLLFVPATAKAFIDKAHRRGADAVVLDLEDAIPPEHKDAARACVAAAAAALVARGMTVLLRVNAEPAAWQADLAGVPLRGLAAIMLPKVESAAQVRDFAQALQACERAQGLDAPLALAALVESPMGVLRCAEIAAADERLCALGFGVEDYCAGMGLAPGPDALRWPAQQLIVAAHAHGLGCWGLADTIAEVADLDRLRSAALQARALGFTGCVAVHPSQVGVLNAAFSPSAAERDWATRVVSAADAARAAGSGVLLLDGRMVDRPIVERARRLLAVPPLAGTGTR